MKILALKNKSRIISAITIVIAIVLTISLTSSLYFNDIFKESQTYILGIALIPLSIILIFNYKYLGILAVLNILLSAALSLTILKALEGFDVGSDSKSWNWHLYTTVLIGLGFSSDSSITFLERIKQESLEGNNFKKAYKHASVRTIWSIFDANLITLIIGLIMFLFAAQDVQSSATGIIFMIITSFISIQLINRLILHLIFANRTIKKAANWTGVKKIDKVIKNKFKKLNLLKSGGWNTILVLTLTMVGLLGFITIIILDAVGTESFDERLIGTLSSFDLIRMLASSLISFLIVIVYGTIKHKWSGAVAISSTSLLDIILVFLFLVITRIKMNEYFSAAIIIIFIFSINNKFIIFSKISEKQNNHVGLLDKNKITTISNESINQSLTRIITILFISILLLLITIIFNKTLLFSVTILIGLIFSAISTIFITSWIWTRLELLRIKGIKSRTEKNFWETGEKEEQVVQGINDYND